ncbi:MAG: YjfB family protein [Treponema sp.]|nr:YjfB family protein [Treponema sp.]
MDIASASMISSQANIMDQVGVTMLSKSLKGSEQQASDLIKGLGSAAPLPEGFGQHIDIFR